MRIRLLIACVFVAALSCGAATTFAADKTAQDEFRQALRAVAVKSLALLETSGDVYMDKRKCFSCHHQALPMMARVWAGGKGFELDGKSIEAQAKYTAVFFTRRIEKLKAGQKLPGGPYTAGYGLVALDAAKYAGTTAVQR